MSELIAVVEGTRAATIRADKSGRLSLEYESSWRESDQAHSLSVSMPLAKITYEHKLVMPYLSNLLPENPNVLQRWGQQYHVSAANPFKLLMHVGEDVPGAAQFVTPERLEEFQSSDKLTVQWLTADDVAQRLRQLRADISAVRLPGDIGRMSLPGAQAKTALYWDKRSDRWGVPNGRTPTTHIIKPCVPGFAGLVENEHMCQELAARLGLPAARSRVLALDETYIVVERYDRLPSESGIVQRIHQEDMCQALSVMPASKYQEDGGPGVRQIVDRLRRVSANPESDVDRFVQANIFNWLIGGTDAHAKNYSLLISAGDEVLLAPFYDLSSQLPYEEMIDQRLAMKIGDRYEVRKIGPTEWRKFAQACAVEEERVLPKVIDMARALPDAMAAVRDQALADGLSRKVVVPLADQLIRHANERLRTIAAKSAAS